MKYDLHVHTTASDGKEKKLSLLRSANEQGLEFISFTDHNYIESRNIESINEEYMRIYNAIQNVCIIEGIEFDIFDEKNMHILGYGIKSKEEIFCKLHTIAIKNDLICQKILLNIYKYYGIYYTKEEILSYFNEEYLTKRIIIDWMVLKGHAKDYIESGSLFTNKKSPTYERKQSIPLIEVLELIKTSGGISILAHPSTLKLDRVSLDLMVKRLKKMGLDGIEIFNASKTTIEEQEYYTFLAQKYNLLTTSGTDFHNYQKSPGIGIQDNISETMIKKLGVKR